MAACPLFGPRTSLAGADSPTPPMTWLRTRFRCPAIHGETVPATSQPIPSLSAPPVGGSGGPHQGVAELAKLWGAGAFVQRGGDIFGRASHLVNPIGQVSGLVGGEHHGVLGQRCALPAIDRRPLLVRALPARLAAVLAAPTQPAVTGGDGSAAPAARLRAVAACHGADFSRGAGRIPVSWKAGSPSMPGNFAASRDVVRVQSC